MLSVLQRFKYFQGLRIIWGYLQKLYSKAVCTSFKIQKLRLWLGEGMGGGGERKEAMTNGILGEEGRRRCPFLSPTLFWLVIPHPTASAGQKNSDISSAPAQGNDVVAQNNKCKQVALSIHLSPPSPQLFGQIIRGGENIRWKEQSPGWWRCWEVS